MKKRHKKGAILDFIRAREFVRKLGLKNQKEWENYVKGGNKPFNIPYHPDRYYKKEWVGMKDWLGTEFNSFLEGRELVRKYNFKNIKQWFKFMDSKNDIANKFPYDPSAYYKNKGWISWMDWLGTQNIRGSFKKYLVNEDFFKKWSKEMAYVLGLWWADGWIIENKKIKCFAIALHKKDKSLLDMVLKAMEANYKLYDHVGCYVFQFNSKKIVDDIKKLGGTTKKSLTVKFPDIPQPYLRDFIRGYFDGDGSISHIKTNDRYSSNFTSGSYDFIYSLREHIINNVEGISCSIITYKPRKFIIKNKHWSGKNNYYVLNLGFKDTVLLGEYLYEEGGIRMERKYVKYTEAVKLRNKYVEEKRVR
jgi:hypothetical protein